MPPRLCRRLPHTRYGLAETIEQLLGRLVRDASEPHIAGNALGGVCAPWRAALHSWFATAAADSLLLLVLVLVLALPPPPHQLPLLLLLLPPLLLSPPLLLLLPMVSPASRPPRCAVGSGRNRYWQHDGKQRRVPCLLAQERLPHAPCSLRAWRAGGVAVCFRFGKTSVLVVNSHLDCAHACPTQPRSAPRRPSHSAPRRRSRSST